MHLSRTTGTSKSLISQDHWADNPRFESIGPRHLQATHAPPRKAPPPRLPMIVQCTQCRARFRVADDKVPDRGVKVRCTKCATIFKVTRADAVESTGRQTAARDTFGLAAEPTPSPKPAPRPAFNDFDLGLDLGQAPAPSAPAAPEVTTPRQGHAGHVPHTSPAPSFNLPPMPPMPAVGASAQDHSAFDAAVAGGHDPFADLDFDQPAPAPPPPPPAAPPAPASEPLDDPYAQSSFASNDPFAELADQNAQAAGPSASFEDDPFAEPPAAPQEDPFADAGGLDDDPFAAASQATDPFAGHAAGEDPFAHAAPASDDGFAAPQPPSEQLPTRSGGHEFDFAEQSVGPALDLNLAEGRPSPGEPSGTEVAQINLAAKVGETTSSRAPARRSVRRELASALFNVVSAGIVGFAALVAIASLRSPRELAVEDLGFNLVWIALGYEQPVVEDSLLRAVDVHSGTYLTRSGNELFYVRGKASNASSAARAAVHVAVEVVQGDKLLGRAESLARLDPGPEALYALDSRDNTELQRKLAQKAPPLALDARDSAPFVAVFPLTARQLEGAEVRVSVFEGIPATLRDTVKLPDAPPPGEAPTPTAAPDEAPDTP